MSFLEVEVVHIGNFEFAAARGFQAANLLEYGGIVQVDSDYGVVRFRIARLFFDADNAIAANLGNAKTLRILHFLEQNLCSLFLLLEVFNCAAYVILNDVVPEDHADGLALGKMFRQAQSLRDTALAFLIGVVDVLQAKVTTVAQQAQELSGV